MPKKCLTKIPPLQINLLAAAEAEAAEEEEQQDDAMAGEGAAGTLLLMAAGAGAGRAGGVEAAGVGAVEAGAEADLHKMVTVLLSAMQCTTLDASYYGTPTVHHLKNLVF